MNRLPTDPSAGDLLRTSPRFWREWEFWLVAALVAVVYFSRIVDWPICREEPRRATVAMEILETGDWVVGRQQGQPFLSRPPAGSWPIALLAKATGSMSLVVVRLPTVLATLLTTLLIFAYARQFLSRLGGLGAALSYATFAQVLQLGRLAETEATFTLPLAGSLMLWHWGYSKRWPALRTWLVAYALVAIATLVKSLQAPVYFGATVGLYLIWRRDWRYLFSAAHLAGVSALVAIFAAWQIPFYLQLGWPAVRAVWIGDVQMRFDEGVTLTAHMLRFPLVLLASLLPWSALLPAYVWPQFRRTIGAALPLVVFAAIAWLVAFPTCWLVPNAKPRYIMPLYPMAAVLVGVVVDRVFMAGAAQIVRRGWDAFMVGLIAAIAVAATATAAASWLPHFPLDDLAQPAWFAAVYLLAAIAVIGVLVREWNRWSPQAATITLVATACFLGLSAAGMFANVLVRIDSQFGQQVAQLKARVPESMKLESLGPADSLFRYYWRDPITLATRDVPKTAADVPPQLDYFCFVSHSGAPPTLPFAWQSLAVLPYDYGNYLITVGRRGQADQSAKTGESDAGSRR